MERNIDAQAPPPNAGKVMNLPFVWLAGPGGLTPLKGDYVLPSPSPLPLAPKILSPCPPSRSTLSLTPSP